MNGYNVNATVSFSAWVYVEADTPEEAMALARGFRARDFDYDSATGEVEFNVEPAVEEVPF